MVKVNNYISVINKLNFYLGILIVLVLPVCKRVVPFIIILWGITWLLEMNFFRRFKLTYGRIAFFLLLIFYILHITGIIYSDNINAGLFDLEVKTTLLIFPVLLIGVNYLYRKNYGLILSGFVAGNCIASLICISNAVYNIVFHGNNTFFYDKLSVLHHPTYFSMYLIFSIVILFEFFDRQNIKTGVNISAFRYIVALLFIIMILLLSSKAGIICGFIVLTGLVIRQISKTRNYIRYLLILSGIVVLFVFAIMNNQRFRSVEKVINEKIDIKTSESSAVRVLIWKASLKILKQNPVLGVGTGDVKDELLKQYINNNMAGAVKKNLNAHNQFLETALGLGFAGFIILLLILAVPFIQSIKQGNYLLIFLIFIAGFNFLFESMLNTSAGVVFFSFFYCYLNFIKPNVDWKLEN